MVSSMPSELTGPRSSASLHVRGDRTTHTPIVQRRGTCAGSHPVLNASGMMSPSAAHAFLVSTVLSSLAVLFSITSDGFARWRVS